jgi:CRISPR-associated protein Cmr4
MANLRLLFIHALSPIHVGTGQSLGAVDLAIARDRATGMPVLPGSGIKGALRDKAKSGKESGNVTKMFGPETENASEHAGGLVFGDGNLLLMPVRSVAGTFAWVTSEHLLRRFARDCKEVGHELSLANLTFPQDFGTCLVGKPSALKVDAARVVFEDLDFKSVESDAVNKLAQRLARTFLSTDAAVIDGFGKRLCVVHDDVMAFLAQHATDVVTRVSLDPDTKTAKDGQLWTEESLPTESVLVSVVMAQANKGTGKEEELLGSLKTVVAGSTQFGGKSTVGRGRVALTLAEGVAQ